MAHVSYMKIDSREGQSRFRETVVSSKGSIKNSSDAKPGVFDLSSSFHQSIPFPAFHKPHNRSANWIMIP